MEKINICMGLSNANFKSLAKQMVSETQLKQPQKCRPLQEDLTLIFLKITTQELEPMKLNDTSSN
jgi:hypothetical protein